MIFEKVEISSSWEKVKQASGNASFKSLTSQGDKQSLHSFSSWQNLWQMWLQVARRRLQTFSHFLCWIVIWLSASFLLQVPQVSEQWCLQGKFASHGSEQWKVFKAKSFQHWVCMICPQPNTCFSTRTLQVILLVSCDWWQEMLSFVWEHERSTLFSDTRHMLQSSLHVAFWQSWLHELWRRWQG